MEVVNGHNAAILVYGQTGSGKTYTMFGEIDDANAGSSGLVPRCCDMLLEAIQSDLRWHKQRIRSAVTLSYVELYGNEVTDLLRGGKKVGQSRVAADRYVLDGAADVVVPVEGTCSEGAVTIRRLLHVGAEMRRKASTEMNERSSRAHAIVTLTLTQTDAVTGRTLRNRCVCA